MGMRADEDTFMNMPTTSASRSCTYDEYPTAWIFEKNPITEEGPRIHERLHVSVKKRLGVGAEAPQGYVWYDAV
eukprot:4899219-Pyramimonas_sp.AAC.1